MTLESKIQPQQYVALAIPLSIQRLTSPNEESFLNSIRSVISSKLFIFSLLDQLNAIHTITITIILHTITITITITIILFTLLAENMIGLTPSDVCLCLLIPMGIRRVSTLPPKHPKGSESKRAKGTKESDGTGTEATKATKGDKEKSKGKSKKTYIREDGSKFTLTYLDEDFEVNQERLTKRAEGKAKALAYWKLKNPEWNSKWKVKGKVKEKLP
jgi:hypothetical protein